MEDALERVRVVPRQEDAEPDVDQAQRRLNPILVILVLVSILLFLVLFIWFKVSSREWYHSTTTSHSATEQVTRPIVEVIRERRTCNRPRCRAMGHALTYGLNHTVPPCSSVWDHACTGWITAPEPVYRKVILGSANLYIEDMYKDMEEKLLQMNVATLTPNPMQKASFFYQSCTRHRMQGKDGMDELRSLFQRYSLRGWPYESSADNIISTVLPRYLHDTQDSAILDVHSANSAPTMSTMESQLRSNRTVYLALDCPSFPMPGYVHTRTKMGPMRNRYFTYMKDAITSYSAHVGTTTLAGIFAFERNQAFVVRKHCYRRRLKRVTVADLTNDIPGVDWTTFLNDIVGRRSSFKVFQGTVILIRSKKYLRYVASLRQGTKNVRAVNYIGWRLLHLFGRHASRELLWSEDMFRDDVDINVHQVQGFAKECLMLTNDVMPMAVGRVFVETLTGVRTFFKVERMIQSILFGFKHMLSEASWIVNDELQAAYARIDAIRTIVSIPPWIENDVLLTEYYNDLAMDPCNVTFFGLLVNATAHTAQKRFMSLDIQEAIISGTDEERKKAQERAGISIKHLHSIFPARIVDLNLHRYNPRQSLLYDVVDNVILLPARILQPPYYDPDVPYALNYGGLGVLLLHDIVTEFFRFYFNIANNNWRVKLKCINSGVYTEKEDSTGEASQRRDVFTVAFTMMIVRAAYRAYHYYMDAKDDQVIPGVWPEANPHQIFFLSAVRSVCSLTRDRLWARLMQPDMTKSQIPLLEKIKHSFQGLPELHYAFHCSRNKKDEFYACMEDKHVMEESPAT
ncbi:membrane metallo-endopeptidase-like 1 [Ornithodoros turicata]|uniref:membrane metallo-endopeptidase-like 1 n=1 Tax=Ornithodoros turicata TaxID=34597 RepID=UPI003138C94E